MKLKFSGFKAIAAAASLTLAGALLPQASDAATWYLIPNMGAGYDGNWNTLSAWNSAWNGTGQDATSINSADTYIVRHKKLMTTASGGSQTFGGGLLQLNGGGTLALKSRTTIIGSLLSTNDADNIINHEGSGAFVLEVGNFTASRLTYVRAGGTQTLDFKIGTLTGTADLVAGMSGSNPASISLSVANAADYAGNILVSNGTTLTFTNSVVSTGGLVLNSGGILDLSQNLSFASFTIAGTSLEDGTYSYSALKANYGDFFTDSGSGSIRVGAIPEASDFGLISGFAVLFVLIGLRCRKRRAA